MDKAELIERLKKGYEWRDIEFKEARRDVPKNAYETVSAFANTEGGHLVFGVRQNGDDFEVVGSGGITVIDPTDLSYSSMDRARRGEPVSLLGVKLHILVAGGRFQIQTREASAE